jgi:hypothetical protein
VRAMMGRIAYRIASEIVLWWEYRRRRVAPR